MNLNPFNKNFGNRLWGMSFVLWIVSTWWKEYPHWANFLAFLVFLYFLWFGVERFDKEYRKIL